MLKECKLLERVSLLVTLYFEIRNTKNLFSNAIPYLFMNVSLFNLSGGILI